jgi:hypothetical protein
MNMSYVRRGVRSPPPHGFVRGKVGAVLFEFSQGCALELDDKLSGYGKISSRAIQKHKYPVLHLITPPTTWRKASIFDVLAPRAPDRPRTELRGGLGATLKPGVSEVD